MRLVGWAAVGVLSVLAAAALPGRAPHVVSPVVPGGGTSFVPCPAASLPDHGVCIPASLESSVEGEALAIERNRHRDRSGRVTSYDHIPRRPERPADYARYRLPVPPIAGKPLAGSGYDLHLADEEQRRGTEFNVVGHGGVDLVAERSAKVGALRLEHQTGDAELLFVGDLFGTTVLTLHEVAEAGTKRPYLVIYGHLERAAADLARGNAVRAGATLGFVGDTGSPGAVHLHLEIRRVREDVRIRELGPRELVHPAKSIACDPRNLLEMVP